MNRIIPIAVLISLSALVFAVPQASATSTPCDLFAPQTVTTPGETVTVPVPASVGPVTTPAETVGGGSVGGQTVGGQSVTVPAVGPVVVPTILSVSGVPVLGTVTVGGQTVGPFGGNTVTVPTEQVPVVPVPAETVPSQTVGPVPTGLQPITVQVFPQTTSVPFSASCAEQTALGLEQETLAYERCVVTQLRNGGDPGSCTF